MTGQAIWVTSDLAPDETGYVATIHLTENISYPFKAETALEYAMALLRAWGEADYDAAVFAQVTQKLGMPDEAAAGVLKKLRNRRPSSGAVLMAGPVLVVPGVSVFNRKPFLRCEVGDLKWQWDGSDVYQHVRHVLEVVAAVECDTIYRAFLVDELGIEPDRALNVVEDISTFREQA